MPCMDSVVNATHEAYYKREAMDGSIVISAQGMSPEEVLDIFAKIKEMMEK